MSKELSSGHWGSYYKTRFQFDPRRQVVWNCLCDHIQKEIPTEATILELGAGYCDFINHIKGVKKFALDLGPAVKDHAAPGVEVHVGSCTDLSFLSDASVDTVFASNLLEHLSLDNVITTSREVLRVLRTGGKFIIVQPNFRYCFRDYFDDYTHLSIFTDRSLPDLLKSNGFSISKVEPKFMPFSLKGKLPVFSLLIKLYLQSPVRPRAGQMLIVAIK
jgi:SAM-dependent methyltransferase